MKRTEITDKDHITRYCSGSRVNNDGTISGAAFQLREKLENGQPEDSLSVNWLEYLRKKTREDEIVEIQKIYAGKLRNVGSRSRIAVLNVGRVRNYVFSESEDGRNLRVFHKPSLPRDPSHSGVYGLQLPRDIVADLIAQVIQETHPAR